MEWQLSPKLKNSNFSPSDFRSIPGGNMVYCIHMADSLGVDLEEIINSKMDKNEKKYPVEKAKGNSKKYTQL